MKPFCDSKMFSYSFTCFIGHYVKVGMLIYIESTLISHTCTYALYATFMITTKAFHPLEWDYKTLNQTPRI